MKQALDVIKIGGNVIDHDEELASFIHAVSERSNRFILVHGGGKLATSLCDRLNIPTEFSGGRRITDAATLEVAVMVYAGQVNKKIVSMLQARYKNAIGMSGADANIIQAVQRPVAGINYGLVGDVLPGNVSAGILSLLMKIGLTPVLCPVTHNKKGQLLNTNADTIASAVAVAMSRSYDVKLYYCFEKAGVLNDPADDASVVKELDHDTYMEMKKSGTVSSGMLPKLDNAFAALQQNVKEVIITHARNINNIHAGTRLVS